MSSNELGNIQCILCKVYINFMQGGKETFYNHLKSKHDIVFNQDLVMAVNFLDKETTLEIVVNFESQFRCIMNDKTIAESSSLVAGKEGKEALIKEPGEIGDDIVFIDGETDAVINLEDDIDIKSDEPKSKTSFVCSRCNETFDSKKLFLTHVKTHDASKTVSEGIKVKNEKKPSFSCSDIFCNETFSAQSDLTKHTSSSHKAIKKAIQPQVGPSSGNANACPICHKVVKSLKTHTEDVHERGYFPCPKCQKVFTSKNKQSSHTSRNCRKTVDLNKTVPTKTSISKNNLQPRRKSTGSAVIFGERKMEHIKSQVLDEKNVGIYKENKENLKGLSKTLISKPRSSGRLESVQTESKTETRSSRSIKNEIIDTKSDILKVATKFNKNKSKKLSKRGSTSKRRSGVGSACPTCQKVVSSVERHTLDMHSPAGHFPCPGCKKVFSSKNRQSSHTSRRCNPNKVN